MHDSVRHSMVDLQIKARGIQSERVLWAFYKVPRHEFVPIEYQQYAYSDRPIPIGFDQTISQPYMVALMTSQLGLKQTDRVLEIGTGSGYQTAILAELVGGVYTVERLPELLEGAKLTLQKLGYQNTHFHSGNGSLGWERYAPYDAILVSAASSRIPQALLGQLKIGGRMVIPIGDELNQTLQKITKREKGIEQENLCACAFVPLIT